MVQQCYRVGRDEESGRLRMFETRLPQPSGGWHRDRQEALKAYLDSIGRIQLEAREALRRAVAEAEERAEGLA